MPETSTPASESHAPAPTTREAARRLAPQLPRLSPGDLAQLRRLDPDEALTTAYWKLWAEHLVVLNLPAETTREEHERRWAIVLAAMARLVTRSGTQGRILHNKGVPIGRALAAAGYSELRLDRLFRADGEGLADEVRRLASFLSSKAVAGDLSDLAELVIHQQGDRAEKVRRSIARAYFSHQPSTTKEP